YKKLFKEMKILSNVTPEIFLKDEKEILRLLKLEENLQEIPLINHVDIQNLKDNSLVRFRGMLQDMLDPEIYLEKYAIIRDNDVRLQNGRYRDAFVLKSNESVDLDSPENLHGERRSIFIVSVPGTNDWVLDVERENCQIKPHSSTETTSGSSALKRPLNDQELIESEKKIPMKAPATISNGSFSVKESPSLLSREYLLNSPIADRPTKACIVKIYNDFDDLVLNTVVDVVGFLSVDAVLDGKNYDLNEFDVITEVQAANPPPSLIPRIHAILVKPVNHINPLVLQTSFDEITDFDERTRMELCRDIQLVLTQCLFGDTIAAEYLMAHLISTVYVRTELECLGQFSLNLSNIPASVATTYTKLLYEIIEMMLPVSHCLPMTLDNLNLLQFSPKNRGLIA
ncbi:Mini-chromosome maintenance complex-binding protein, partial [Pseudolycoriella hygida]